MEKLIRKTTREYFKDADGDLIKEIETVEEYTINEITDGYINGYSITKEKINPDLTWNKGQIGADTVISGGTIKADEINPPEEEKTKEQELKELEDNLIKKMQELQSKGWIKTTGVPQPNPFVLPNIMCGGSSSGLSMDGVLVLNDASLDELIGSAIKRIEKKMAQEAKKNPKL